MKSAYRLSVAERDRAIRRIRELTIGTAVAGVIATAGLASVAAASNEGSSTDQKFSAAAEVESTSDSTSDSTTTTTTTPSTGSSSVSAAATPATRSSGNAHVSTGSS